MDLNEDITTRQPVVSVVIPVFNACAQIGKCVESVLNAGKGFYLEVICVDDGSIDNSFDILTALGQKHPSLKVIHTGNRGVTAARQTGISVASGRWIMFVDADDTIPDNALDIFLGIENIDDYDIIVGLKNESTRPDRIITVEQYRRDLLCRRVKPFPWGKLFNRRLFDEHVFDISREINHGEDLLMNLRLSFNTTKPVYLLNKKVYNYIFYPDSLSHSFRYSIEFQDLFDKAMTDSFPADEIKNYMTEITKSRIKAWKRINWMCLSTRRNRDTRFYSTLCRDIKQYQVPLSFDNRLNIYANNPLLRALLIAAEQLPDHIVKRLKSLF